MLRSAYLAFIALFFGVGLGFMLAVSTGASTSEAHDHGAHDHGGAGEHAGHDHSRIIELPAELPAPRLDFVLHEESAGGWNLEIRAQNFRFAPAHVNGPHVPGEGHAHIYVDGVKLARAYGPWFHIAELPEDAMSVTVTLNSNDHAQLSAAGTPLSVTCAIPDCLAKEAPGDG